MGSLIELVAPGDLDDEALLAFVHDLAARRHDASVIAIDPQTLADRREVLREAGFDPRQIAGSMEQVERVAAADQARFVSHSLRVAEERTIVETVALADDSLGAAGLYDLRGTLGVYVGILAPLEHAADRQLEADRRPRLPARVGRVQIGSMGEVRHADDASAELLGLEGRDPREFNAFDVVHPDDRLSLVSGFIAVQGDDGATDRGRGRLVRADGSHLWAEISFRFVADPDAPHTEIELVDITAEMSEHEQLVQRERLLDGLTRSLPVGVLQVDGDGRVRFSNDAVGTLTGVAQPVTVAAAFGHVVDEERPLLDEAIAATLHDGEDRDIEIRLAPAPGEPDRICSLIIRPLDGEDGEARGAVVCVQDVTVQAMARADLETRVLLDPLTRSLNRDGIMESLRRCLGTSPDPAAAVDGSDGSDGSGAPGAATTVIYIDLDRFKQVNDRFGHRAGDRVLRTATDRIRGALRDGDLVGRIGGDEFVAICAGVASSAEAMRIASRIAELLAQPLPDAPTQLRASVGVVTALPGDRRSAEALLADGDAAMYESKRAGLGRPVLFGATST